MFSPKFKIIAGFLILALVGLIAARINNAFNEASRVPYLESQVKLYKDALRIQSENFVKAKKLTQTVSQNYENILTQRDADYNRVQKRASTCVIVQPSTPARSPDATYKPNEQNIANGVSAGTLFDFARDAETDRAKVISLQEFIKEVYKANGYQ